MRKLVVIVCLLPAAACTKPPAETTQPSPAATNNANSNAGRIKSTDVVKVTPQELTLAKGKSGYAVVRLQIQNGYHVNANPATFPYLIPTELKIAPASGISVSPVAYPKPVTKTFSFADEPLKVYEGDLTLEAMLNVTAEAETGQHNLSAKLRVQACDDQVCYVPGTIDLTIPVEVK